MVNINNLEQKQKVIRKTLESIAGRDANEPAEETIKIMDDQGGHYLLFNNAWRDGKRYYGCFLHIDLHQDGKVWLQHDGTDQRIAELLISAGIRREDIVLAFQPPSARPLTGFAVA
jgi:XisI protein